VSERREVREANSGSLGGAIVDVAAKYEIAVDVLNSHECRLVQGAGGAGKNDGKDVPKDGARETRYS